jgi:predicted CXXCH cytochrome family protein
MSPLRASWGWSKRLLAVVAIACAVGLAIAWRSGFWSPSQSPVPAPEAAELFTPPATLYSNERLTVWWQLPSAVDHFAPHSSESNIHPADYTGPSACQECHPRNYESWSNHSHRWMNALADETTVKGDFSGSAAISYLGGRATFYRQEGHYRMKLERGAIRRVYEITQTIGSRFFQYYVGKQLEGPEPPEHHFYQKDHVLQFGYWLDQKEWVPIVHVGSEDPDGKRADPFAPPERGGHYAEYAVGCNYCHSTFPLGDIFGRNPKLVGSYAPISMQFTLAEYLKKERPGTIESLIHKMTTVPDQRPMGDWDAEHYAVTLGISCEACHLGGKEHVESEGRILPKFIAVSPYLFTESANAATGRTHDNVNWVCGRCHIGKRPQFAAGMSTWNSVEYSDAMRGSCYSQLRCIDCHNPHVGTGPKWTATPEQDDAKCLKCHDKFKDEKPRAEHTHHLAGSEGARCMNCHMPRINEGLQDTVRTHMIYSPTRADMIEANHPNACSICHTDKPIDWTLGHLKDWYGKSYNAMRLEINYPRRTQSAAESWLHSPNEAVRLVDICALGRSKDPNAVSLLVQALDDSYLLNRQFAQKQLEDLLGARLANFGYHFYMSKEERRQPLADLRAKFASTPPSKALP